ncbi:MAG: hypothetical protein ACOYM0_01305 [Bacteroidales bacterium]
MATYQSVYNKIKAALTGRTAGTLVLDTLHEVAEIAILDYVEQLKSSIAASTIRNANNASVAGVNCDLIWNTTFTNTEYDYSVNGFDAAGNPVEIILVSKVEAKLVVKTLINANLTALAVPRPS